MCGGAKVLVLPCLHVRHVICSVMPHDCSGGDGHSYTAVIGNKLSAVAAGPVVRRHGAEHMTNM